MVENFRVMTRVTNCCLGIKSEKRIPCKAFRTLDRLKNESCLKLSLENGEDVDRFSIRLQSDKVEILGFGP